MSKVCVLIRVYNRTEDLKYCVDIIRNTWKSNEYFVIVVFNGEEDGYKIDEVTINKIDLLLKISNNTGHFSGNSQLLLEGLPQIPTYCDYTIILEADTWLYGDELICKYISLLETEGAVWASAQFFRYVLNLATDFAILKTDFIRSNSTIFKFNKTPEYFVANYLEDNNYKFIYIEENMPINLPRYIRRYPFAPTGRFFIFPAGKMVTHHVENLKGGMNEKMLNFNMVAEKNYFDIPDQRHARLTYFFLKLAVALTIIIPYKGWFIRRKD